MSEDTSPTAPESPALWMTGEARWTRTRNLVTIECICGQWHEHPADRWQVRCSCGTRGHLATIRRDFARKGAADHAD